MKKRSLILVAAISAVLLIATACGSSPAGNNADESAANGAAANEAVVNEIATYIQITQDEAMKMMEEKEGYVILDVRTEGEYAEGHIPGALNIPVETIGNEVLSEVPDTDQLILVYCRSGNRSKTASDKLANAGYTNVYEFGGINTWTGDIEK